ncbi:hypothetical protein [Flavobacterium luminosum]|uniref:Anti-sigma factor n=1 Tax=Flavobacterium luminosum TaxID=2949086 RepID=A0ABT0TKJ3_9FLAO|nr:hypothetical protein [Flavobacterium sp. HXWNR70]MCL9808011.1 hypothetical protein [Flavobacterium sp. HXWNR70]
MEQNNFEKHIKEALDAREISPSSQSWERLEAMLSIQEEKKTKRRFFWVPIAASFLVLMTIALLLVDKEQQVNLQETPSVVEQDFNNRQNNNNYIDSEDSGINTEIEILKNEALVSHQVSEQKKVKMSNSFSKKSNSDSNLIAINQGNENLNNLPVVADHQIQQQKEDKTEELLLAEVEKPKMEPKAKVKINPKELLSQVDGEIELTFRQKVIRTIKKNYQETKVAIATRNQESSSNH